MQDRIKLSEHFFSLQGEGITAGTPAVFIRLSGCVLLCSYCDTMEVWKQGEWKDIDELDGIFETQNYYNFLRRGARLVITGGDPLIHQEALATWFERLKEFGREPERICVEVETEGCLQPNMDFGKYVRQWNVSPKLANSGMPLDKRYKPEILKWHSTTNSFFKFPIASPSEIDEVHRIVKECHMRRTRVYLMPICSTREEHLQVAPAIADCAKKAGYRFSPRLQLILWDKATGC